MSILRGMFLDWLGGVPLEKHQRVCKYKDDELAEQIKKTGTVIDEREIFYDVDLHGGKTEHCCDEDNALAVLLADGVCFSGGGNPFFKTEDKDCEARTCVRVLCNDLFYWACADCEELPVAEIGNLYRMHKENPKYGSDKWCCLRRNLRPQVPIVENMKKDGFWDAELEALPAPEPS